MNVPERILCPRRAESFREVKEGESDGFREDDDTCRYCGSLNPDTFMARLEAGDVELDPTDKSYKIYVRNRGGAPFKQTFRDCYEQPWTGKVKEPKCTGPDDCTHWVTRDTNDTKFYFQHLSADQQRRFIELHNEKRLHIGYPGHFYSRPFFCAHASQQETGR